MRKLKINRFFFTLIFFISMASAGCATVWEYPLPESSHRTKFEISKIWGSPTSISTNAKDLKYGADEVWIYKSPEPGHPSLVEERLYFQHEILIKREGITVDAL